MKYVVPVNAVSEVPYLVDAGAAELYCGYQDAWWVERYGDHDSATRRQGAANLNTREELSQMADAARCKGAPLYLALNSRYTEPQLDYLVDLCKDFERMGGTGVIASDLGLLWRLKGNTGLTRCLSLLAVAQNTSTLHAYRELGVTRVVLPRFVGPQEAARLLRACGGIEAEVMAFFDKCPGSTVIAAIAMAYRIPIALLERTRRKLCRYTRSTPPIARMPAWGRVALICSRIHVPLVTSGSSRQLVWALRKSGGGADRWKSVSVRCVSYARPRRCRPTSSAKLSIALRSAANVHAITVKPPRAGAPSSPFALRKTAKAVSTGAARPTTKRLRLRWMVRCLVANRRRPFSFPRFAIRSKRSS